MKRVWIGVVCGVMALMFTSCAKTERYTYTPEDRAPVVHSDAMKFFSSGTETNTGMADLIAQVEIVSDQYTEERMLDNTIPYPVSYYEAKIKEIWYGEAVEKDIMIWFAGTTPVLHQYDQAIIYATYADIENYYVPVDGEYSVFVLNPPNNTIFPFAMIEEYEAFDNNDITILRTATDKVISDVAEGNSPIRTGFLGKAAKPYYEEYLSSVEGEVTE